MAITSATADLHNQRGAILKSLTSGILFGLAGFALNWFKLELFFNIDFLFGSIITMFALMRFGLLTGVTAALIAASCTYLHWHQPWAIIIFTVEAFCTGLLYRKRNWNPVVGNLAFWLSGGLLLVILFYQFIMGFPFSAVILIALKQSINGIANTLVASAFYIGYCYKTKQQGRLTTLRQLIFVTISLFVVLPAFFYLYIDIRHTLEAQLADHRYKTLQSVNSAEKSVSLWFRRGQEMIRYLAVSNSAHEVEGSLSLQKNLDTMRAAIPEFKRLGVVDARGVTKGFSPAKDDTGLPTIGLDLSARPYISAVMKAPHPEGTQLFTGKIGTPGARLILVAPILDGLRYNGAAFGVMELDSLKQLLRDSVQTHDMNATIVDDKGQVVASTRTTLQPLDNFILPINGTITKLSSGVSHWVPTQRAGISAAKRWMSSFYFVEQPLETNPGWKLVVEASLEPTLLEISHQTSLSLAGIGVLLLLLIFFSRIFSKKMAATISDFETLTRLLPGKIAAGEHIEWPAPSTVETLGLTDSVRLMCEAMEQSYDGLLRLNENLEQLVEERTNKITEIMQEMSIILENAPIGISKLIDRKQVWVNHKQEELFMYPKGELEFQTTRILYSSEEAYEELGHDAYPLLAQGLLFESVQEMVRKDGAHIFVRFIVKAIDPADMSKGALWLAEDITERKLRDEELTIAKEQAELSNNAKSEFLANMSHEIRTPMNGVIGMTQLLEYTDLSEQQQEYVEVLKVSAKNLLSLINDILDLSKIEAGKIKLELTEFSLQHCINDIALMQKAALFEKNLPLTVDIADDVPHVLTGDQLRFKQILLNLLGNAVKFTTRGCIAISVQVLEKHDASALIEIAVRDTGIGISGEALDRIFEPFVQADGSTTRKYGGTGLGLTISLRLAELLGGSISVESSQKGSCFKVVLPFLIPKTGPEDGIHEEHPALWNSHPLRILFVEDNPINITFGTALFKKLGHKVTVVVNGSDCIAALAKEAFDLVMMDIQMPVMTGDDALRKIRKDEQINGLHQPVIALTAYSLRGEKERFLEEGFDGYVSKPFAIKELMSEMHRVMSMFGKGVQNAGE